MGEVKRRHRTALCWHTAAKEREAFCDRVGTGGASEVHAQDAQRKQCNCSRDPENGGPDEVLVEAQMHAKGQGRRLDLTTSGRGTRGRSEGQERPPQDGDVVRSREVRDARPAGANHCGAHSQIGAKGVVAVWA